MVLDVCDGVHALCLVVTLMTPHDEIYMGVNTVPPRM